MARKQYYISFSELKKLVRERKITRVKKYRELFKTTELNIPYDPQRAYPDQWIDWYNFFGKERTQKVKISFIDKLTIYTKNIDIYSFFPGKYKIENEELIIDIEPHLHLYSDYWIRLYTYNNTYTIAKDTMILNNVESNQIYINYKQFIKNGKQKILEEYVKSYISYFCKKNIKGRIFIFNSRRNVVIHTRVLAYLYDKIIVFVKY